MPKGVGYGQPKRMGERVVKAAKSASKVIKKKGDAMVEVAKGGSPVGMGGMKSAAAGLGKKFGQSIVKKSIANKNKAVAGGGGMHQMGTAQKTKKQLNAKQRALMALRKNKGKII